MRRFVFGVLPLMVGTALAGQTGELANGDAPPAVLDPAAEDWQSARDQALEWWRRSRDEADELWRKSRALTDDWWQRSGAALGDARAVLEPAAPDPFAQLWTTVIPTLEDTVELRELQRDLPETAWFKRDQADVEADINALLDQAVAILSTSPVQQYRAEIAAWRSRIDAARAEIAAYRKARVGAPAESMVARTQADYDRLIERRQADIGQYQRELDAIKREFAKQLRAIGMELSDEQVEFLLATVVGDTLVDLGIVFDNVKALTLQLEQLVRDSGEDLQSARRYYGMYVVLLRALLQMHFDVEQSIETRYIPQINDISEQAQRLREDTRALLRAQPDKTELLAANLDAQRLTIEASELYRGYLARQAADVREAREALKKDIDTAWNTYETVRVSGELIALVRSSQRLLDGLLKRQVPALQPFKNLEMKREFEKLTDQLRASQG